MITVGGGAGCFGQWLQSILEVSLVMGLEPVVFVRKMGSIWDTHTSPHSMWDLVPQPGVEPMPPALAARSFNHFTTGHVPRNARTLLMGILVYSDYKTPGPKSQAFPLHSSGARSPWSKCQDIQGLVSSLFLACRWPHSCCSPHVTFLCMYRHGRGGKREGSELRCLFSQEH